MPLPHSTIETCEGRKHKFDIDEAGANQVAGLIEQVRKAGLEDAAKMFETIYWGWLRTVSAYVVGHPYVAKPEEGMTPISALGVVDFTLAHWALQIPGSPQLDDKGVLDDAAVDEAWHREEDRRMRRAAGEEI